MSKNDLLLHSHKFTSTKDAWWYEDNAGIDVMVYPHVVCQHLKISWTAIRAALKRKDKP